MRATLSRFGGWLLTSPLAFFVSFVIDVAAYCLGAVRRRVGGAFRRRRTRAVRRRTRAS